MELSWSTFLLEILNFLVLVWILKRFLYKPVREVIARRQAGVEAKLAEAENRHAEATALKAQYESRLADWDTERQQARQALQDEIEAERRRRLDELDDELAQAREKAKVADAAREADARHQLEETGLRLGARFASRLLELATGPELERRLIQIAIDGLADLSEDRIKAMRSNAAGDTLRVSTAFALPDDQRNQLIDTLKGNFGSDVSIGFEQDPALLAGIHIRAGAWELGANLRDELRGFTALIHDQ